MAVSRGESEACGRALRRACLVLAFLLGFPAGRAAEVTPWYAVAPSEPLPEARLRALAGQLGAPDFGVREAAEEKLKQQPRAALAVLRTYADADDPEIAMRIRRITAQLLSDSANAPRAFYAFSAKERYRESQWREVMAPWYAGATVAASNTREDPNSATAGCTMFAQSFVPGCDTIAAVEIKINTRLSAWGWLRLRICEDRDGRPGGPVLAVAWLRTEKESVLPPTGSPITGSTYVPFDIPDIAVDPKKTYWMTYLEYPDPGTPPAPLSNFTLSKGGYYPQGCFLGAPQREPSSTRDAHFRVISKCGPVPVFREPTAEEMATLPDARKAHFPWMRVGRDGTRLDLTGD